MVTLKQIGRSAGMLVAIVGIAFMSAHAQAAAPKASAAKPVKAAVVKMQRPVVISMKLVQNGTKAPARRIQALTVKGRRATPSHPQNPPKAGVAVHNYTFKGSVYCVLSPAVPQAWLTYPYPNGNCACLVELLDVSGRRCTYAYIGLTPVYSNSYLVALRGSYSLHWNALDGTQWRIRLTTGCYFGIRGVTSVWNGCVYSAWKTANPSWVFFYTVDFGTTSFYIHRVR